MLEQAESAVAQQIKVLWLSLFVDLCDPPGGVETHSHRCQSPDLHRCAGACECSRVRTHTRTLHVCTLINKYSEKREEEECVLKVILKNLSFLAL